MKAKIILLIIFLMQSSDIFSQTNVIVNDGKRWSVMITSMGVESPTMPVTTRISVLLGDTVINKLTYKKIYSTDYEDLSHLTLEGCIRQNNKQIFYLPYGNDEEKLYFDFALEAGDTFTLDNIERTVISTGNVTINNTSLKTIILKHGMLEDYWIEGIGSTTNGIFSNRFVISGGKDLLLCCHQENILLYMNKEYNECFIQNFTDIQKLNSEATIPKVYYDHISKKLRIQGAQGQIFKLELFDVSGEKRFISKDISDNERSVDISHAKIESGVYIYRLFNESNQYIDKLQIE